MLCHIDLSVSREPIYSWMVSRAFCKFPLIVFWVGAFLESFIPLYAIAWVSVFSFAPCMSNSISMSRLIRLTSFFLAPSFARRSLPLLPLFPLCPLTHLKVVGVVWILSRWAAFWKWGAFLIPIQLQFSHVLRCVVRPFITYFESVNISSGWNGGVAFIASMTATSSPTWFDWDSPGTLITWFFLSSGLYHIPLPLCTFIFPLL